MREPRVLRLVTLALVGVGLTPIAQPAAGQCAVEETEKLLASDGAAGDDFGRSVSVSGAVAVVGARRHGDNGANSGSVYVYRRDGSTWIEEAELLASDGTMGDWFGASVSVSGVVAVVGAEAGDGNVPGSGSVYVYRFDGFTWIEEVKLIAPDGVVNDFFGQAVSICGNVAVVGAPGDDDNGSGSGSAYVYRFNGSTWDEEAKLLASDGGTDDNFGVSVSVSDDVAVVGALWDDDNGTNSGSAYVYRCNGSTWIEEDKLLASDGGANDYFGHSVSVSGDVAVVGAVSGTGENSGSVYVYRFDGFTWMEEVKLIASDGAQGDQFGQSVSVRGDMAVVGAHWDDDNGPNSGSAYVYRFNGQTWIEEAKLFASDGAMNDTFGSSVSFSGDVAIVGATGDDTATVFNILCNAAVIQFDPPEEFPATGVPTIQDVGDLDNDTDPDVVIALPGTDEVEVFLNQGGDWNGLVSGGTFSVGENPSGLALGLFDNDLFLDVAVSNADDGTISILLNDGAAGFIGGTPITGAGSRPTDVIAADFNEDTFADIAVSDFIDNTLRIYHGDGLGGFVLDQVINTGGLGTGRVRSKDVDNDKDIDILGVNQQGTAGPGDGAPGSVFVLTNLSDIGGAFDPVADNYDVGATPIDLTAGDLDLDFFNDIAVVNLDEDTASVLINNGDGTFTVQPVPLLVGDMPLSIDAVDLDGDLSPDLAIVVDFDAGIGGPAVQVLANVLNEGNGLGFADPLGFSVNADPKFIASADFNADEAFDLVTVNEDGPGQGSVTVLLGARAFFAGATGFAVPFGEYQSGTISDLYESDDMYVTIGQRAGLSPLLPLIRIEISGTSSTQMASQIVLTLETAATALPATVPQKIAMRNHVTSVWESLDSRLATLGDSVIVVTVATNASRFIEPGTDRMELRLDCFDPGDVFFPAWASRIDQAIWTVMP